MKPLILTDPDIVNVFILLILRSTKFAFEIIIGVDMLEEPITLKLRFASNPSDFMYSSASV
ncbi:MAG: hypothetical protein BWY74_02460 [Firmicutes bacterium ADurb.Bin419]|nr:MAG: hypothetical protein BWY74_02460 [Firmicutes bacterium ADurb.Bin419]